MEILNIIRLKQLATFVAVILTLAACGGGDDDKGGGAAGISLKAKTLSATSIRLNWTKPDGVITFSTYNVSMEGPMYSGVIVRTSNLTYTVTNLVPDTKYCFVIKIPLTGHKASNRSCATTHADTTAPTTPSGVTAEATSPVEVDIRWNSSSDDDSVSGYNVFRNGELWFTATSPSASDPDVTPGTSNCYAVSAFDESGNESPRSPEACADTPLDVTPPSTPTNVSAAFDGSDGQSKIDLSWNGSTDDGRVELYQVFRDGIRVSDETQTQYTDVALDANARYCYTVVAVDSVGNASTASEPACAREGWTSLSLWNSSYAKATAVAVDNADRVHVAFKEYEFDTVRNETRRPLTYALIENGQIASHEEIDDGTETYWFSDEYMLAMVTDHNNVAHLAHKRNEPPNREEIRYLQVDGGTVTPGLLQQTSEGMSSISLAVDSVGAIHACYGLNYGKLIYATNATGVWTYTEADSLVPGAIGGDCDIAVDNAGSIHISYLEYSTQDLMYLGNVSGGWTLDRVDIDDSTKLSQKHHTSIKVDAAGNPHIAYVHGASDFDLHYATKQSGSWTIVKINTNGDAGFYCDLALDSRGFAHIVYRNWTTDELKYASNQSGNWISDVLANATTAEMSIAVDSADNIHMTFVYDTQVKYITNRD